MVTEVVHCKKDEYDVYIGRPSEWGNQFNIGPHEDRRTVVKKYGLWVADRLDMILKIPELKDKVLGCWCKPELCHGDILAALADNKRLAKIIDEYKAKGDTITFDLAVKAVMAELLIKMKLTGDSR